ncbi:MAG: hypothetical protein ACTHLE_12855 [Agriterribacter sp.]
MKPVTSLFLLFVVVALSSCSRYYYRPNAVNTPLFTEGGQARLNAAGSIGSVNDHDYDGNTYFFNAQAAVSPINHLGIIANYSNFSYSTDNIDETNGNVNARAHLLEGGIGGYYAKGKKFKMVVDGYVGYGGGKIHSDVDMRMRRYFFQPGIGVRSPWFDAAFNLRIANVKYLDFDSKGRSNDYLMQRNLVNDNGVRIDNRTYTFAEPAFTIRTGYKFAKAQFQVVFAQEMENVPWRYNGASFSAGISFSVEEAFKKAAK